VFGRDKQVELPRPLNARLRDNPPSARTIDEFRWLESFVDRESGDEVLSVARVNGRHRGERVAGYLAVTPLRFLVHLAPVSQSRDLGAYRSTVVDYGQIERYELKGKAVQLNYFEFVPDIQFTVLELWGLRSVDRPTVASLHFHAWRAIREEANNAGGKWLEILSALAPNDERLLCLRVTVVDGGGESQADLFLTAQRVMWVGEDGEIVGALRRGLRYERDGEALGHFRLLFSDETGRESRVAFRPAAGEREWHLEAAYRVLQQ
jgi:hypothetical protein